MRKIFLYLSLIGLGACSTPNYVLTTYIDNGARAQSVGAEVTHTQTPHYYHTSYTYDNSLKELLIPVRKIEESGFRDLQQFLILCNEGKFKQAKKILAAQSLNDRNMDTYLEGLILFMQKKHPQSIQLLESVNTAELRLQYELLLLDNEYELQKRRKKLSKSYFINKYQQIIDSYSLEREYAEFINARIKSLRYS